MTIDFRQVEPAADLRLYVRHYWVLRGRASPVPMHPIFPDGCGEIVFNLGPPARELLPTGRSVVQPGAMLVGQMTRPVQLAPGPTLRMIGVKLAPWGAAALLGESSVLIRDATAALDALGSGRIRTLADRLEQCADDREIGLVLDEALRETIAGAAPSRLDRVGRLAAAVQSAPRPSLSGWMHQLGCSARTLERHFARCVGLSPKEFVRLRRFQMALRLSSDGPTLSWATVAARAGYCDQAHLGRDFRQFAGAAPTVADATSTPLSTAFIGESDA